MAVGYGLEKLLQSIGTGFSQGFVAALHVLHGQGKRDSLYVTIMLFNYLYSTYVEVCQNLAFMNLNFDL